jgi:hypothetical protein
MFFVSSECAGFCSCCSAGEWLLSRSVQRGSEVESSLDRKRSIEETCSSFSEYRLLRQRTWSRVVKAGWLLTFDFDFDCQGIDPLRGSLLDMDYCSW